MLSSVCDHIYIYIYTMYCDRREKLANQDLANERDGVDPVKRQTKNIQ